MIHTITLRIQPDKLDDLEFIKISAAKLLALDVQEIDLVQVLRRSVDARGRRPVFQVQVAVYQGEAATELFCPVFYQGVKQRKKVVIVGSGPAGLFAALRLIERGLIPIVLERGKDVKARRFDLKTLQAAGQVNPDSNFCFGEGGAGTYSDGKLYTRSTKRGNVKKIMSILVQHGAVRDILVNAHPHIGSNKLPRIIKAIRDTIENCNGQIHFNSRVIDLILQNNKILGVQTENREFLADAVILATGHSARDIYELLDKRHILMEAKDYAMGVRVEHSQELINAIQYGKYKDSHFLPAASYSLACQVGKTGVYSFCMCPGGMIIPAATATGELVLNGMSNSARNMPHANAGIVVTIGQAQYQGYEKFKHFAGLELQKETEKKAFHAGGSTQAAPAQRLTDFIKGRISSTLPTTSYIPGTITYPLQEVLGPHISGALKQAFQIFGQKMKGYVTEDATLLAVESRTSSPVRIPRMKDTWMHPQIKGLFPLGEGSGYAGGIVSSAIDGDTGADAVCAYLG